MGDLVLPLSDCACLWLYCTLQIRRGESSADLMLPQPLPLCGDIKVEFFHQKFGKVCVYVCVSLCVYLQYVHSWRKVFFYNRAKSKVINVTSFLAY